MTGLQEGPIDVAAIFEAARDPLAGGIAFFVGTVRQFSGEKEVVALEFEAASEMARHQLDRLVREATERFRLTRCVLVHRLGRLSVGEVIVVAAAAAPHRQAAFAAIQWLVDQMKQVVPIWKKEHYREGPPVWIHPGCDPSPEGPRV